MFFEEQLFEELNLSEYVRNGEVSVMGNMVSLWLGNFETENDLFALLEYTEDGDWISSTFC